jgi:hypothetical protein
MLREWIHRHVAETVWIGTFHFACSDYRLQNKIHDLELEAAHLRAEIRSLEKKLEEAH